MKRNEFFLVALPGLEDVVLQEVQDWFPELDAIEEYGGVTVKADLATGLSMNLVLKTPTRILVRVDSFKCRDFPKLYNKVKSINWSDFLKPETELTATATARLSRLNMKARIEKTSLDGYRYYKKEKLPRKSNLKTQLFVRLHKDVCTLSLDTSGERLHKRGQRTHVGEAPLRETIAASLILMLQKHSEAKKKVEVIDPMMGSGSFLIEAQSLSKITDSRDFAFEAFQVSDLPKPKLKCARPQIIRYIGFEIDSKACEAAEHNGVQNIINEDIFKASKLETTENERWLFCNPPYGERLEVDGPLKEFYEKLFKTVEDICRPDLACFLLPTNSVKGKFKLPNAWRVIEKRPFLNGGISVTAFVFKRSEATMPLDHPVD